MNIHKRRHNQYKTNIKTQSQVFSKNKRDKQVYTLKGCCHLSYCHLNLNIIIMPISRVYKNERHNELQRAENFSIHFFVHVSLYLWNFFNLEIKFLVFRAHE